MMPSKAKPNEEKPVRSELLKLGQVAKILNIVISTVYQMCAKGELPAHRIGGSIRFDPADIDDYIFFSKFHGGTLKLSAIDKEQIIDRFEEQLAHLRKSLEKIINRGGNTMKR
jgi:excisionase family DNA binding protein